jgi:hypothetical protein
MMATIRALEPAGLGADEALPPAVKCLIFREFRQGDRN